MHVSESKHCLEHFGAPPLMKPGYGTRQPGQRAELLSAVCWQLNESGDGKELSNYQQNFASDVEV